MKPASFVTIYFREAFLYTLWYKNHRELDIESFLWQTIIADGWTWNKKEEHLKEKSCPSNLVALGKSPESEWMRAQRKPTWVQVYHSLAR